MFVTLTDPDWTLIGCPQKGGYAVFASKSLTGAQLSRLVRQRGHRLTCEMYDVVAAWGRTYPDALAQLMTFWQPPMGAVREIEAAGVDVIEVGPRELEAGRDG